MDDVDRASAREERQREDALRVRRAAPVPCMACHNCGEALAGTALFCDADCRDDWQRQREAARRAGRA